MIYLDYNASTPVDPRVASLVQEASRAYANPSSTQHGAGQQAAELVEHARQRLATAVHRTPREIVFTAGASEAAAIGIIGAMLGDPYRRNAVIAATEHKAIIQAAEAGARLGGGEVRVASVGHSGLLDLSHLNELVDDSVSVVAVMAANNETGVMGPVAQASVIARNRGALFFSDVTQLLGKGDIVDVSTHADLMVCSSHKLYGPKGAGALIASRHTQKALFPVFGGGGQEFGLRGGTSNVPALAGFGLAAELATHSLPATMRRLTALRDQLWDGLRDLGAVEINGADAPRVCNTLNVRIVGADAEAVMASLPDVAVSSGSACQSAVPTPSHVLLAMGRSTTAAGESLRLSVGTPTTDADIRASIAKLFAAALRVRELTGDLERRLDDA
ncbi:cysteine desulfurase family protein [Rhodococcus aetherivorans]|uniref:cysteine desulfurase family protein n=1 Tax=Rhodococcus aetherivorans TaxID=191292 RepID=UPI001E491905|nr:cysteine desulfurase family protein [Rhodococcus aetherivorans]UGQ39587.1 cysteine desulfurase [Rhodococcus aetherivorans]